MCHHPLPHTHTTHTHTHVASKDAANANKEIIPKAEEELRSLPEKALGERPDGTLSIKPADDDHATPGAPTKIVTEDSAFFRRSKVMPSG